MSAPADARLHAAARHLSANPACPRCGGAGWIRVGAWRACACVGTCARCGGAGYLFGGLEACACRVATERMALLDAAALPDGDGPLDGAAAAWFARFRPEAGWPWLTLRAADADAVAGALARLVTGVGVPVATVTPGTPDSGERGRVVACFGIERLGPAGAARLVDRCVASGRTLVVTTALDASAPDGLAAAIGEMPTFALWEHGTVLA